MNDDHLISLPPSETTEHFSDALSDLIRRGARQIIAQAVERNWRTFWLSIETVGMSKDGRWWCATATCPSAR